MLSLKRLKVEHLNLLKEPVPYVLARPKEDNILEWRFLIQGTEGTDYEGGFYHGKLEFPPQYPMKPPGIMFCTPSGRFEINKRVCLTISDFHPETWSPLWTVGSILTGIVSFMNAEEMTTGGLAASSAERKAFAAASAAYNAKDKVYVQLFGTGEPLELFLEAAVTMQEYEKKRRLKSEKEATAAAAAAAIPRKLQEVVSNAAAVETQAETQPQSKSAKKRAKEKEKSRRLTALVEADGEGEVVSAPLLEVAEVALAGMKLSGESRPFT